MKTYVLGPSHAETGMCDACGKGRWGWPRLATMLVQSAPNVPPISFRICRRCLRDAFYAAAGKVTENTP